MRILAVIILGLSVGAFGSWLSNQTFDHQQHHIDQIESRY